MEAVELAAAARHGCKVCGKSFLCGRSLGGHMRSHISLGEAALEVHADDELRRASPNGGRSCNGVVGYGLRENPRKTRRLSDFANDEDGGHGVGDGDGDGDGEHKACRECGKLFSSWRSLFGHMRSHASGGRYRDDEDDVDVEEEEFVPVPGEAEAEEAEMVTPMEAPVAAAPAALTVLSTAPRRRRRSMRVAAPPPAPPPPVMSGFEKEPEDVALCLLMLSRDTGMWSAPSKEEPFKSAEKQAGLPRSGYGYNSDDDSALLQHGDAKIKGRVAKSRKRGRRDPVPVAPKRTRYECPGCGKVFSSYQALGGHRASHKRINASCSSPKVTPAASSVPEPSTETYASFNTLSPSASPDSVAIGFGKSKEDEAVADAKFECAVCFRVFASVEALGWHKRSHLMPSEFDDVEVYYVGGAGEDHLEQHSAATDAAANHQEQHSAATDGFLDLNFPPAAPEEA